MASNVFSELAGRKIILHASGIGILIFRISFLFSSHTLDQFPVDTSRVASG